MKQNRMETMIELFCLTVAIFNDRLLMTNCRTVNGVNENHDVQKCIQKKGRHNLTRDT